MIKIPLSKYNNGKDKSLIELHYNNIEKHIIDVIQIYINCFNKINNILDDDITYQDIQYIFENNINYITNLKSQKSILNTLLIGDIDFKREVFREKKTEKAFNKNDIHKELYKNCNSIKSLLEEFVNIDSKFYIKKVIMDNPKDLISTYKNYIYRRYNFTNEDNKNIFQDDGIIENCKIKDIFNKIFDYDKFSKSNSGINTYNSQDINNKWNAYKLCEKLNVRVCPYCNRNYTFTIREVSDGEEERKENIIRPQLDHFFPQSKFPMFALSFYNLIPSCSTCNSSIKGAKQLSIDEYHPYTNGVDDKYKFDYRISGYSGLNGDYNKVKVYIKNEKQEKVDNNSENEIEFFHLNEIYAHHNDIVARMVRIRNEYPNSWIDEIVELINLKQKNNMMTREHLIEEVLDKPKKEDIVDISLGKLKLDIIEKLMKL